MKILTEKVSFHQMKEHKTKRHVLIKFFAVLFLLVGYFIFMAERYGIGNGFHVTFITWSFFVLSTPIADAGFLIDFPSRLLLNIRMIYSEMIVWIIAIGSNIYTLLFHPEIYDTTQLLIFFKKILVHPFPFWGIFLISMLGTFISVYFGDELMNTVRHNEREFYHKHKHKYHLILLIFVFGISFVLYGYFIQRLGINIPSL